MPYKARIFSSSLLRLSRLDSTVPCTSTTVFSSVLRETFSLERYCRETSRYTHVPHSPIKHRIPRQSTPMPKRIEFLRLEFREKKCDSRRASHSTETR